jgi:hypothetical protein
MRAKTGIAMLATAAALAQALGPRATTPPALALPSMPADRAHVRGVVHVHTSSSPDGHGDFDSVARAASRAGLAFVVVTDHNTEASVGIDGYRHGVLLLGGVEKSTDAGHALALGLTSLPFRLDGDPAEVVRDVSDLGGFVIVSHPASEHAESAWRGGLDGVAGVEILNLAEPGAWPRGPRLIAPVLRYFADPQGALLRAFRAPRAALEIWDRGLRDRPLAGLLGSDAHGGLPAHEAIFRFASQHLILAGPLSGDADRDRMLVLDALRGGRGWLALDSAADASRFVFEARSGGQQAGPGQGLALAGPAVLRAEVAGPEGTVLVLLRDGAPVERGRQILHATSRPGSYRVEAYLDPTVVPGPSKPWILSGAIDLYPAAELAARQQRARWLPPRDSPPLDVSEALDDFSGAELDPRWQIDRSPDAVAEARLDRGALRFDFHLGSRRKTHASLCNWGPRDLSSRSGLVLGVRADRRFRFDVQVRVEDPAAPGRVHIWRRSVRAEPEARTVSIRFADLKTYDAAAGRPDLARVRGLYLHLDEAHLPPGSAGTLWLEDAWIAR